MSEENNAVKFATYFGLIFVIFALSVLILNELEYTGLAWLFVAVLPTTLFSISPIFFHEPDK